MYLSLDKGVHIPFLADTPYVDTPTPDLQSKEVCFLLRDEAKKPLLWHDSEPFFDVSHKDACGLLPCVVS